MNKLNLFKNIIENNNKIVIYRHLSPDGDAMFSALALKSFINDNYPNIDVKLAGKDTFDLLPYNDDIDDSFIENSLSIILDTSTINRIDDQRFVNSKYIIRIDHHPLIEKFGDLCIIDKKAAATCELLTSIFKSSSFKNYKLSNKTAEYLYCGLISDSQNFKTNNTTYKTLSIGSFLVKQGINSADLYNYVFSIDINEYKKKNIVRNNLIIKNNFGYVLFEKEDLLKNGLSFKEVKNCVDEFNSIKELNIYAIFAYNETNSTYEVSIRSKNNFEIFDISKKYGGGGHLHACGVKGIDKNKCLKLIDELAVYSINK